MDLEFNIDSSFDELMTYVNDIREKGYLFMIKYDGEREEDFITVLVTSAKQDIDPIRMDGENLKKVMCSVLNDFYVAIQKE